MSSGLEPIHTLGLRYRTGDNPAHTLDMFAVPPAPGDRRPAAIWVHGGGWYMGERQPNPNDILAERGWVTFAISYRFSQEAIFPAQIRDVRSAIRFVRSNAAEFGVDPARIGIWGHSAGGHLAALAATGGDNSLLDHPDDDPAVSAEVQAAIALSPPSDFLAPWSDIDPVEHPPVEEIASAINDNPVTVMLGLGVLAPDDFHANARLASATAHASATSAPMLIVHGVEDDVVPVTQGRKLNAALEAAGATVDLHELPEIDHDYERVLGLSTAGGLSPVQGRALAHFERYAGPA